MNAIDSPVRTRVVEIPIDESPSLAVPNDSGSRTSWFDRWIAGWWCDAITLICLGICVANSFSFWKTWLQTPDRIAFFVLLCVGILVSATRANWDGNRTRIRLFLSSVFWLVSILTAIVATLWGTPELCLIGIGAALAAWCWLRITGEGIAFALAWPSGFAVMAWIWYQLPHGFFNQIPTMTMAMTGGLADAIKLAHVHDVDVVVFGRGQADQFQCMGTLSGIITLIGVGMMLTLAFRRNLIPAIFSVIACGLVWVAVRASSWATIAWLADQQHIWTPWSPSIEWMTFGIAIVVCISLDQVIGILFAPIPDEYLNTDYPLFSLAWNWVFGLPRLSVSLPQRESDFPPIDSDTPDALKNGDA